MKYLTYLALFTLIFSTYSVHGQNDKKQALINDALKKETIENQFEILIEKSPNFQNFKNIKLYNLNQFKTNFKDTLKAFDNKYRIANAKIEEQRKEIEKLNSSINSINTNLLNVTEEKDSIEIFGVKTTKTIYNLSLWSLISALLFTTLVFLFRFRSSNKQTKEAKLAFNDIENEFETHRKNSLEREQVLRRKLQDEINKQRNV